MPSSDPTSASESDRTLLGIVGDSYFDCEMLLSAIPDVVMAVGQDGAILQSNDVVRKVFGYSSNELFGRPFEVLIPERFRAAHISQRNDYIAVTTPRSMGTKLDLVARRQSGEEFPVEVSLSLVGTDANRFLICIVRDISERKQIESQLRKAEARYRSVVERMPAVTFMAALDGGINELYVSPQIEAMLGFTQSEWLGDPVLWYRQLHPDDRERWHNEFAQTCATGQQFRSEYRFISRDGRIVWVHGEASMVRDEAGAPQFLQGFAYDITQRKMSEQVMRRSQEELENLVRERTGELASANGALRVEIEERRKAEEDRIHYVAQLEDATARIREQASALQTAKEQAESANRSKSEFLANMSHEIRTPMTAILGFADLLADEGGRENSLPDRVDAIRTIQRNGEHLLAVINDILDLSKIESGRMELECIPINPIQLCTEVVSLMRVRAEQKRLSLEIAVDGPVPDFAMTDPVRLRQVLVNLIGNAIKFTDSGGVRLTIRFLPQQLHNPAANGTSRLQFEVFDTGAGMSPMQAKRLFQPFSQADASTTRKYGGTGLGLAISKRLAKMLGGDLTCTSQAGEGSTFLLEVEVRPVFEMKIRGCAQDAMLNSAVRHSLPGVPLSEFNCRILLAEDGIDNQRLISHIIRKAGAEVVIVENGRLAVDAVQAAAEVDPPSTSY